MACTVIGLFGSAGEAADVRRELIAVGIPERDVRTFCASSRHGAQDASERQCLCEELKTTLTSDRDRHYVDYYMEGTRQGGTLVTVTTPDNLADRVVDIMHDHNVIDVDECAAQWKSAGWTGPVDVGEAAAAADQSATPPPADADAAATDEARTSGAEKELAVGKREASRGGVRVVRHAIDRPGEAAGNVREEYVIVERKPAEYDPTTADVNRAFGKKVMTVTETAEEPGVTRAARVVEEVTGTQDVQQRRERVRDTARKSDVEVERLPGREAAERTDRSVEQAPADQAGRTRTKPNQP